MLSQSSRFTSSRSDFWHDVAQICLNGHVTNDSTQMFPQFSKKFCDRCGSATITECPECNHPIQGDYYVEGVIAFPDYEAPAFCLNCGKPFPWTQARVQAAKESIDELAGLSESDKETAKTSIDEITADTPRTDLAANRLRNILSRAGNAGARVLERLAVEVATEAAKKAMTGS